MTCFIKALKSCTNATKMILLPMSSTRWVMVQRPGYYEISTSSLAAVYLELKVVRILHADTGKCVCSAFGQTIEVTQKWEDQSKFRSRKPFSFNYTF